MQRTALTAAPVPKARVRVDRRVAAAVPQALAVGGLELCDGAGAPMVLPIDALGQAPRDGSTRVALFDGKLTPDHAKLLETDPPTLLLACRDGAGPSAWEARALAVCLTDAPLTASAPGPWSGWRIEQVADLHTLARDAEGLAKEAGAASGAAAAVADVMYELAANALFDAPVGRDGKPKYAFRRSGAVTIDRGDGCRAGFAAVGGRAYLFASDLFGRLTPGPVIKVIAGLGAKAKVDASGGGAGLGLRRVVEHSDLWSMRVSPGISSEVLCVLDLTEVRLRTARPKSLFFRQWTR